MPAVDRQKMSEAAEALRRLAAIEAREGTIQSAAASETVVDVVELAGELAEARKQAANALLECEALAVKLFACRWLLRHYRAMQGSLKNVNLAVIVADLEQAVEHGRTAVPVPQAVPKDGKNLTQREKASLLDEALRLIRHADELLRGAEIRHQARLGVITGEDARRFEEALLNPQRVTAEEYERARAVFERVGLPKPMERPGSTGAAS